jgi:hypothetical protein
VGAAVSRRRQGGQELARSEAVTFSAADAGACGNLADMTIWRRVAAQRGALLRLLLRVLTTQLAQRVRAPNTPHALSSVLPNSSLASAHK